MKFKNTKRAKELIELISNSLYELEVLNDYRKNNLNKIIEDFKKIKVV